MSSFFTLPASQRKRKRDDQASAPSSKRRTHDIGASSTSKSTRVKKARRDESISGSESEDDVAARKAAEGGEDIDESSESDVEDETGAERRLRLAERYLENIKSGVNEEGFDAAQIDRDLIAERLKEDVAETKGRLYRHITSDFSFATASKCHFRTNTLSTTSIAVCPPYVYTVSKDMTLTKWELPTPPPPPSKKRHQKNQHTKNPTLPFLRRRPKRLLSTRGNIHKSHSPTYQHHTAPILTIAASSTNRFVATGGADKRLIIWSATDLTPLRVFTQHRDSILGLAFRRGTNQLYSSAADRTIKSWSLDELAYVETLFGHQDQVVDVAALAMERCLSVGARDRTVRLWKVVEETQLVFRGGGGEKKGRGSQGGAAAGKGFAEGSIDRVAMIDEEMFVTGSDNGALALWSVHKKKPVFVLPVAHELDPPLRPEEAFADVEPEKMKVPGEAQPRWITALATVPYSDLVVSGSWDGWVRVWRISEDKRRIESVGTVGRIETGDQGEGGKRGEGKGAEGEDEVVGEETGEEEQLVRGVINDIALFERGEKGKDGLCIVAAVGVEHRLGRWKKVKGKNGAVVFEVPRIPR